MPTVVIADDSPTLRRIVSSVLTRDGFEVIQAEDGVEAVQTVLRTMPDAVVLDVQMPRVSGYVAARLSKDDCQTAARRPSPTPAASARRTQPRPASAEARSDRKSTRLKC